MIIDCIFGLRDPVTVVAAGLDVEMPFASNAFIAPGSLASDAACTTSTGRPPYPADPS